MLPHDPCVFEGHRHAGVCVITRAVELKVFCDADPLCPKVPPSTHCSNAVRIRRTGTALRVRYPHPRIPPVFFYHGFSFPHFTTCCVESHLASVELIGLCHRPTCTAKGLGTVQPPGVNFNEYEAIRCDSLT